MSDQTHYLGDGCQPPHAMGQEPPVGIDPPGRDEDDMPRWWTGQTRDRMIGPEIRHLTVATGDIDRILGWFHFADVHHEGDERLAAYLREMREKGPQR